MKKILVVEDNEITAKLFRIIIESLQHEALIVSNGEDGIVIAKENIPDLIIMDIRLPGMSGVEAFQKLQEEPDTQNIPVIAVTANVMRGDKEKLLTLGFSDYIAKPIKKDNFIQILQKTLGE